MSLFSRRPRRQIGVDIGTSSIKVVELSREGSHPTLENYGLLEGLDFFGEGAAVPDQSSIFKISERQIVTALRELLQVSRIETRQAIFSIPIFSSFLTVIELPFMDLKDLERAVPFQARSYIPVPLAEVVLDWLAIPPRSRQATGAPSPAPLPRSPSTSALSTPPPRSVATPLPPPKPATISVLLVAVPKEVISKYHRIVEGAGLALRALESESFSLVRSLIGNDPKPTMLVDFGARSTTLTIVDQGFVRMSHTADLSGKEITRTIARGLNISTHRAEELKKVSGIGETSPERGLVGLIEPLLERLVNEYEKMAEGYFRKEAVKIERIILAGGAAGLPGLVQHLSGRLLTETIIGNAFSRLTYPSELDNIIKRELARPLAVAAGLALRDF